MQQRAPPIGRARGALWLCLWSLVSTLSGMLCPIGVSALDNNTTQTPPMGMLNWGTFRCNVDCETDPETCVSEKNIKGQVDAMVAGGYVEAGYVYVNIDDCWPEKERDTEGRVVPDLKRFPSGFKALGDYVHQHGMLFGFYTAMGSGTCAGYPALNCTGRPGDDCAQARRDVAQYVAYGIDSLKIDGCQGMVPEHFNVSYPMVGRMILEESQKLGRPVAYSCSWPAYTIGRYPQQYALMAEHCNTWRNYDDAQPGWASPAHIIEYWGNPAPHGGGPNEEFFDVARPGAVNDPDEIYVGDGSLTHAEEQTVFALWAIMTGPVLLGIDFRKVPPASAAILLNKDIIAVSQDPLVRQGRRVTKPNATPTPVGTWVKYQKIWNDTCANVGEYQTASVTHCEQICIEQSTSCTAINFDAAGSQCYLRACPPNKLIPNWDYGPDWSGYAFNGTIPGRLAADVRH